jgi:hypothetical protein
MWMWVCIFGRTRTRTRTNPNTDGAVVTVVAAKAGYHHTVDADIWPRNGGQTHGYGVRVRVAHHDGGSLQDGHCNARRHRRWSEVPPGSTVLGVHIHDVLQRHAGVRAKRQPVGAVQHFRQQGRV